MSIEVPKKFFRNVMLGVSYFTQEKKRACTQDEIVAYVYLKNSRALTVDRVEPIVENALTDLCTSGLILKKRNKYRLTEQLVGNRPKDQLPYEQELAGPSGSGRTVKRSIRSRSRNRRAVDAFDRFVEPVSVDSQEDESDDDYEEDDEVEDQEYMEVLPHRPLKIDTETSEHRLVPVVTKSDAASISGSQSEIGQGSSPAKGSSPTKGPTPTKGPSPTKGSSPTKDSNA